MKISEQLPGGEFRSEYYNIRTEAASGPAAEAAELWVIKSIPPAIAPTRENTTKMATDPRSRERKGRGRRVKFWISPRKARVGAKDLDLAVKNNFLNESKSSSVTFHGAMKSTLVAGQLFGLNPVLGVTGRDNSNLRFSFISWRCLYTGVSFVGQLCMTMTCIYRCIKESLDFGKFSNVIFCGSNCLTTVIFIRIAQQWPELSRQVARSELAEPCLDRKLLTKCNVTVFLILTLALVEHVLALLAGFTVALDCDPDKSPYEGFVVRAFPYVFNYVAYSNFLGIITQFVNTQLTFNWNFTDLFAICVSYYLTSRFEQVTRRLVAVRGKYMPTWFWRTAREDYCRVTQLVRRVDAVISGVVFVSFANNLYFICLQLFHTLELLRGYEHALYFVYSFVYLMARSLAVSLVAARVHSASRAPAPPLYDVPSPVYCVEVQRFLEQVNGDTVALSGLQFFNVTRGLVLTIAGTIVTYELVLVQFSGSGPTPAAVVPSPLADNFTNASTTIGAIVE